MSWRNESGLAEEMEVRCFASALLLCPNNWITLRKGTGEAATLPKSCLPQLMQSDPGSGTPSSHAALTHELHLSFLCTLVYLFQMVLLK